MLLNKSVEATCRIPNSVFSTQGNVSIQLQQTFKVSPGDYNFYILSLEPIVSFVCKNFKQKFCGTAVCFIGHKFDELLQLNYYKVKYLKDIMNVT